MAKTAKKLILDELRSLDRQDLVKAITSIRHDKYSGGHSIRVEAKNLFKPERDFLQGILSQYEHGSFDGMTDSYNYTGSEKEIHADYVFLENRFSDDIIELAKDYLKDCWGVVDDATAREKRNEWYDISVNRILQKAVSAKALVDALDGGGIDIETGEPYPTYTKEPETSPTTKNESVEGNGKTKLEVVKVNPGHENFKVLNSLMENKHSLIDRASAQLRIGNVEDAKAAFKMACDVQEEIELFLGGEND